MLMKEGLLSSLLPEFEARRDMCLFPERCLEVQTEEKADTVVGNSSKWWFVRSDDDFEIGVNIKRVNEKGGGVVRLGYLLKGSVTGLGKDSKKIITEEFSNIHPDLKLVGLWTGIKVGTGYYGETGLEVFLQYSPA